MFRQALCSAIIVGAVAAGSSAARAESRVALVIGESAYRMVTPLPNPANDAQAMSRLLRDSGFEVTTAADQIELRLALAEPDWIEAMCNPYTPGDE